MKTRIFIIDDEPNMIKIAGSFLEAYGFDVSSDSNPVDALDRIKKSPPDLIILDIQMPHLDGFEVCKRLKADRATAGIPVIMVSVQDKEADIVLGFGLGVEDYVRKPFMERELVARVKAILKRMNPPDPKAIHEIGPIKLDKAKYQVRVDSKNIDLNPKEFELLQLLIDREGQVLTRSSISETVWKNQHLPESRTIDTHIKLLRKKLGAYGPWIKTLKGVGYRFEAEV